MSKVTDVEVSAFSECFLFSLGYFMGANYSVVFATVCRLICINDKDVGTQDGLIKSPKK